MSTWHQDKRPTLPAPDKWTIVTDPPHALRTHWECDTETQARRTLETWRNNGRGQHSYIVAPTAGAGLLV